MDITIRGKSVDLDELNNKLQVKTGNMEGRVVDIDFPYSHQEVINAIYENTLENSFTNRITDEDVKTLKLILKNLKNPNNQEKDNLESTIKRIDLIKQNIRDIEAVLEKNKIVNEQVEEISTSRDPFNPSALVGIAKVTDAKTGFDVPIQIIKTEEGRESGYLAYFEGKEVGNMTLISFDQGEINGFNQYSSSIKDLSKKLYVNTINAPGNKHLKGIGSALMQVAYEISKNTGAEGKVVLLAQYQSGGFYYKLGLRCLDSNQRHAEITNQKIALSCQEGRRWDTNEKMYLPIEAMENFDLAMKSKPILFESKESIPLFEITLESFLNEFSETSEASFENTPLHFAMQKSTENNDFYFIIKQLILQSEDLLKENAEGKTFLDEALSQAKQGNLSPLYCTLKCIPQDMFLQFVFNKFSECNSEAMKKLIVNILVERTADTGFMNAMWTHCTNDDLMLEIFENYIRYAARLDLAFVDNEGFNLLHYIALYLSKVEDEGRQNEILEAILDIRSHPKKIPLNVPNEHGFLPGDYASDWMKPFINFIKNP